jgi:osmoprotectant transport system permease protein
VVQTIPALAMLALMMPIFFGLQHVFAGLGTTGFGPAVVALSLYSILPMLRNTVTGLAGVDPASREAGRALGMTGWQLLGRVELPLALPVIVAGVRTATVWVVGMATLATLIGQPSLGEPIISGLHLHNWQAVIFGCALSAVLALSLDGLVGLLERGLSQRRRPAVVGAIGGLIIVLLLGYLGPTTARTLVQDRAADTPAVARTRGTVRIGGKTFTEQHILVELLAGRVEAAGYKAVKVENLGSNVGFQALARNEIDLYVDYSGTIWRAYMKRQDTPPRKTMLNSITYWLARAHGVRSLGGLGFENAYCLAMREAHAERLGIETIADLADHIGGMTLASDYEFVKRPVWRQVSEAYGLEPGEVRTMDPSLIYRALADGEVDVIPAYTSDGRIEAYGLRVLEDPEQAFPPYDALVMVAPESATKAPLLEALRPLVGAIDVATMRQANLMVDRSKNKRTVEQAAAWLAGQMGSARADATSARGK